MNSTISKFGLRFLTRKERTVRRVTKCETRQIKKRLEPIISTSIKNRNQVSKLKSSSLTKRSKPATLIKKKTIEKTNSTQEISIVETKKSIEEIQLLKNSIRSTSASNGRILQSTDLQKLSRLSCSHEFSLFHKEMKGEFQTNEHQLAFLQTKLFHLKNEFIHQTSQQENLQQIKNYFNDALQKHQDRKIKPDEFLTLINKFQQDIKQAIDKWLRKKEFGKQPRPISEYSQKRQKRIQELIQETIQETKKNQKSIDNFEQKSFDDHDNNRENQFSSSNIIEFVID